MVACIEANTRKFLHYLPFFSWRERQIIVYPILLNIIWRVSMYVQSDTSHRIPIKFDLDCLIPFLKMVWRNQYHPSNISWDIGIRDEGRLRREVGVTVSTGTVEEDHLRRPYNWHSQGLLTSLTLLPLLPQRVRLTVVDFESYQEVYTFSLNFFQW